MLLQWSAAKLQAALPPGQPIVFHAVHGTEVEAVHAARMTELAGDVGRTITVSMTRGGGGNALGHTQSRLHVDLCCNPCFCMLHYVEPTMQLNTCMVNTQSFHHQGRWTLPCEYGQQHYTAFVTAAMFATAVQATRLLSIVGSPTVYSQAYVATLPVELRYWVVDSVDASGRAMKQLVVQIPTYHICNDHHPDAALHAAVDTCVTSFIANRYAPSAVSERRQRLFSTF